MMILFARIITTLFHPIVLITPVVFLIVTASTNNLSAALFWSSMTLVSVLFISGYILVGMRMGFFSNFDVSNRKQRVYLFPVVILIGLVFLFGLIFLSGPTALIIAIVYFIFSVIVLSVVTLRIKASVHVGSITAAIIGAIYFFGSEYTWLLILIPIMAWARIKEKRHTLRETIVGFILGLILAIVSIISVQYFI